MTYLTSFPRSGCSLLAFLVESFTGKPITRAELEPGSVIEETGVGLPIPKPWLPPVLSMSHNPRQWCHLDDGKAAHTLLHRHPLEACVSFWLGEYNIPLEAGLARLNGGEVPPELKVFLHDHQAGVQVHRAWKGPSFWIEYDDVVNDPFSVLNTLEPVIGKDIDRAADLAANLEHYKEGLLAWKKTRPLPVWTDGRDLQFFRSRLIPAVKQGLFAE